MVFTQVDSWAGPIATVQTLVVAPTGKILAVSVWWTGKLDWVPIQASGIPVGSALSVSVDWSNNSPYAVNGKIAATLITPSGQNITLDMGVVQRREAGMAINSISAQVTLSEVGSYSLKASLNLEAA